MLWSSAQNLGASFIFSIGNWYAKQACDTHNAIKSMPYFHYETLDDFFHHLTKGTRLVGIELTNEAEDLETLRLPRRCLYLIGVEDHGLSKQAIDKSHFLVKFKSQLSLNISVAGSIVMYDRGTNKPRS